MFNQWRTTQLLGKRLRKFTYIRLPILLRCCQGSYDFPLAVTRNFAVAGKSRQDLFMPEVLAPRLELFRGLTDILAELDKCISKAVRVEVWQASLYKSFPENFTDGRCVAPVLPFQAGRFKFERRPPLNVRCREKRVVIA